jgi:hypothetical protein
MLAGGTTLALLAVAVAAAHPAASPLSPDHPGGDTFWSLLYLGAICGAFACYLLAVVFLGRGAVRLAPVLIVAVLIQVTPLAGPVLLSTDVYTYWARGRVGAVNGSDPYTTAPSAFPGDPALPRMGRDWRDRPTGYGPAFTLLSEGHAAAVGSSPAAAAWAYRAIAAASMLAIVGLSAVLARRRVLAVAFVGWNPLLAVHFAGGGHNDAVMIALVLGALALARGRHPALAGAAWASAIALKWVPAMFLPLRALEARREGRRVSHLGFAAAAAVVAGVATWRYGDDWLRSFGNFSGQLGRTTSVSPARWLTGLGLSEDAAIALLIALFAAAYLWLLYEAWRGRARLALCACLLLLTTAWLVPWYAVWAVPLAAIEDDRPARLLALGLSAYLLRAAVPL